MTIIRELNLLAPAGGLKDNLIALIATADMLGEAGWINMGGIRVAVVPEQCGKQWERAHPRLAHGHFRMSYRTAAHPGDLRTNINPVTELDTWLSGLRARAADGSVIRAIVIDHEDNVLFVHPGEGAVSGG